MTRMGRETTTRDLDKRPDQMNRRVIQPLLWGIDQPMRVHGDQRNVETGHESAQRKRFLRSEAEDSETSRIV